MQRFLRQIRHNIGVLLFPDVQKRLENERASFALASAKLKQREEQFEKYRKSVTITDMVREQLAGFNPRLLDKVSEGDDDILDSITDEEGQEAFLLDMKKIAEIPNFEVLVDWLVRNQLLTSATEAVDLNAINFGRASINGCSLVREEVERLSQVYEERHKSEPEFDEHEVV